MDDDAGMSSESPTLESKQAQAKLEKAEAKLAEAETKLEEAQNAWRSAPHGKEHICQQIVENHQKIVEDARESVKQWREIYLAHLSAMMKMGPTAQSEKDNLVVQKLDSLGQQLRAQLDQVMKNEALLMEAFLDRFTLTPVSEYSSATLDGQWHQQAREHYGTSNCLVLQSLFPDDFRARPWWLKNTGWDSIFPAVAEHIIPKTGYTFVQKELGIQIDDPRNSLLLLRHLEHTFQDGDWSLIPVANCGAMKFKIYVSQELKETTVDYIDRNSCREDVVRVFKKGALQPLMFGDLHERELLIDPPPFLRALFLKARMAWKKHQRDDDPLPDPSQFVDAFRKSCEKWDNFMVAKLFRSIEELNTARETQSL